MTNPEVEVLRGELAELKTLVETISEQNYEATIGDEWMSTKEASAYTKLSVRTINRAVSNGEVEVSKKVGKNLFRRVWLDAWLDDKQVADYIRVNVSNNSDFFLAVHDSNFGKCSHHQTDTPPM